MNRRVAFAGSLAMGLMLVACGGGDLAVVRTGVLLISRGGTGSVLFPLSQETLDFGNSVSVAVRGSGDPADRFTVFTFFGLTQLNFQQVPSSALVTFIDGLDPASSSTTFLPSTVVGMALHSGFNRNLVTTIGGTTFPLAQTAPQIFEQTSNGSFVLEPQPSTDGTFVPHTSTNRQARWAVLTLTDQDNGGEALVNGSVPYQLSQNINQQFFGYIGNLGLNIKPGQSGGGPPPPPGSSGSGGSGNGSGGSGGPPAPPNQR